MERRRGALNHGVSGGLILHEIYSFWSRYGTIIAAILIVIASSIGIWLRLSPYLNVVESGLATTYPMSKLYEMDPFINYWLVKYLDVHGPLSWNTLTHNNPATCIFWYPICRDIYRTELFGHIYTMYVVYEALKGLGVKLVDVVALFPVALSVVAIIGIALLVYEASGSLVASIVAAFAFSGLFIDRTMAGFTVKYTFGICLAPLAIWLHLKLLHKKSLTLAIISGLYLAYIASVWAGFSLTYIPIAFSIAFTPLIIKNVSALRDKNLIKALAIEVVLPTILCSLYPFYGPRGFLIGKLGMVLIVALVAFLIGSYLRIRLGFWKTLALYVIGIIAIIGGFYGALAAHRISVAGKVALALGLPTGRLPHTVAEYQPTTPGSMGYTAAITTIFIALFIGIPLSLINRDDRVRIAMLSLTVWGIVSSISALRVAYFTDYQYFVCITYLSTLLGLALNFAKPEIVCYARRCFIKLGIARAIALLLIPLLLFPSVYLSSRTYAEYTYQMTTISTAEGSTVIVSHGVPRALPTTAWLSVLKYIRNRTPKDSVVVAWWDYGYWISVVGQRASLADGSTINGTQIALIAKFFTSSVNKSLSILKKLGLCRTKDVYVLVYGTLYAEILDHRVYFSTPLYVSTIPLSFGDIPKFIAAIVYIATGNTPVDDILHGRTVTLKSIEGRYAIVADPNGWAAAMIGAGGAGLQLYAIFPDWYRYAIDKVVLPTLFAYGAFKVLQKLYPGYSIELTETTFIPVKGGIYAVSNPSFFQQMGVFTIKNFNQSIFKLMYAGISQPIKLGAGPVYRYVVVLLFKVRENVWNAVCSK